MRAGMTRVEEYSSKLLAWNMPFWRRSKASTFWSMRDAGEGLVDDRARDAGGLRLAPIAAMKALKSPPHWAASEGRGEEKVRRSAARIR